MIMTGDELSPGIRN